MLTGTAFPNEVSRPRLGRAKAHGFSTGVRSLDRSLDSMGTPMSFGRNVEIYGEQEYADHLYKVVSGAVRTHTFLIDGRRQIGAFYLPGDMFGLEAGERYAFSAEAIVDTKVLAMRRSGLVARAAWDSEIAAQLWTLTARELRRAQRHTLLLIKTAPERVASFLLELAEHSRSGDEVELPMSRQDIADYVGLTIESVSRILTQFENASAIEVAACKRIVLRNRATLKRLIAWETPSRRRRSQ
jgi:CRP/FNR family transcriptional regulator, nitrogen fixation regulation protein